MASHGCNRCRGGQSRWHNRKHGRRGTIWEERFGSVVVEEEERALRTMAAYIDLNPVRAGMVEDPAEYRWSGYAEAMAGKARSRRGLVRIIGQMAWPREGKGSGFRFQGSEGREIAVEARPWGNEPFHKGVETRALVFYRAILGGQGAAKKREDGTMIRRGLSQIQLNTTGSPFIGCGFPNRSRPSSGPFRRLRGLTAGCSARITTSARTECSPA